MKIFNRLLMLFLVSNCVNAIEPKHLYPQKTKNLLNVHASKFESSEYWLYYGINKERIFLPYNSVPTPNQFNNDGTGAIKLSFPYKQTNTYRTYYCYDHNSGTAIRYTNKKDCYINGIEPPLKPNLKPYGHSRVSLNTDNLIKDLKLETMYTISGMVYADSWPQATAVATITYTDSKGSTIYNGHFFPLSVTKKNDWQSFSFQFSTPDIKQLIKNRKKIYPNDTPENYTIDPKDLRIMLSISLSSKPSTGGNIYIDNLYLGEGVSFIEKPSRKKPFNGSEVKVDPLGNLQVKSANSNNTNPNEYFFPICIYPNNWEDQNYDWRNYENAGFNCVMRTNTPSPTFINKITATNLKWGLDISGYMDNTHPYFKRLDILQENIQKSRALFGNNKNSMLFYYWDNENNILQAWDTAKNVVNTIRQENTGHPIYTLQGQTGLAKKYNNEKYNLSDTVGTYVSIDSPASDSSPLKIIHLENEQRQISPVSIAQIQHDVGKELKWRLYSAIANGAKGVGIWRDTLVKDPVTSKTIHSHTILPWKDQLKDFSRDLNNNDKLLHKIISQKHWADWEMSSSNQKFSFGYRDYIDDSYAFIINSSGLNNKNSGISGNIKINNLKTVPRAIVDINANDEIIASVQKTSKSSGQFYMELPSFEASTYKLESDISKLNTMNFDFKHSILNGKFSLDKSNLGSFSETVGQAKIEYGSLKINKNGFLKVPYNKNKEIGLTDFTILASILYEASSNNLATIIFNGAATENQPGYHLFIRDNHLFLAIGDSKKRLYYKTPINKNLIDGKNFFSIAVTLNRISKEVNFYFNGIKSRYTEQSENTLEHTSNIQAATNINDKPDLVIGGTGGNYSNSFSGKINDIRLYKALLNNEEIKSYSSESLNLNFKQNKLLSTLDYSIYAQSPNKTQSNAEIENNTLKISGSQKLVYTKSSMFDINNTSLSTAGWIKINNNKQNFSTILMNGALTDRADEKGYWFFIDNYKNTLNFWINDGDGSRSHSSIAIPQLTIGKWYHVAAVFNKKEQTISLYLNGTNMKTDKLNNRISSTSPSKYDLHIGAIPNSGMNGNIGEIKIDQAAWSNTLIKHLYELKDSYYRNL